MAKEKAPDQGVDYIHTSISSGFNQHTPPYWRLALPAMLVRYSFRWLERILKLDDTRALKALKINDKQFFDAAAGAVMMGTTGFFALNTWRDMKSVFKETVAYETNKDPSQITSKDIIQSNNNVVVRSRRNLVRFNAIRALVNTSFFASFLPVRQSKSGWWDFKSSESVDLGLGLNGAYLVREVVTRDTTFFEQLQNFIDRKVNQRNSLGEDIHAIELMRLFERNALDNDPQNAFRGRTNTLIWEQSWQVFERMAELMNNTYQHTSGKEKANFTLPKFLYLIGHNLIRPDKYEQSMAYVEVANRYGMSALKKVVESVKDGTDLTDALRPYPVDITNPRIPLQPQPKQLPGENRHTKKTPAFSSFVDRAVSDRGSDPTLSIG